MKLLDSTFLIDYWAGDEATEAYLERNEETETFVSTVINLKELAVGRAMLGTLDAQELRSTFGWLDFLPITATHAFHAAEIEAGLRSNSDVNREKVATIGADVSIGAVPRANAATVVTRNVDDFELLDDVAVESY